MYLNPPAKKEWPEKASPYMILINGLPLCTDLISGYKVSNSLLDRTPLLNANFLTNSFEEIIGRELSGIYIDINSMYFL